MPQKDLKAEVFQQRWVHSFEEDSAQAQVYRPQSWDFPLSRRPREAFELRPDGTAQFFLPGASDRPEATDASWTEEAGELVIRTTKRTGPGPLTLRIVESGADKLLVRRS
jgi:hypothetical protein